MKRIGPCLAACILALSLPGCQPKPADEVDLVKKLPESGFGPVLGPIGQVGNFEVRPFVGLGFESPGQMATGSLSSLFSKESPQIRFYLSERVPVGLTLESRNPSNPQSVRWLLNGQALDVEPTTLDWQNHTVIVGADRVREGTNLLQLKEITPNQWRGIRVYPADQGRSFEGASPQPQGADGSVLLPFGRSVSYSLDVTPESVLHFDEIGPWVQPGAAQLTDASISVEVRLESEEPLATKSWQVKTGKSQNLRLGFPQTGNVELTLTAHGPKAPLAGQLGIRLGDPRLEKAAKPLSIAKLPPMTGPKRRPNIVIYLIDTLRSDHLGCYGYSPSPSPNIDTFSRDSILFTNCNAQSAWTKTSTASIFTSMLPRDHQALDFGDKIKPGAPLLAEVLQRNGYETRGVSTNPVVSATYGFARGFNFFEYLGEENCQQVNRKVFPWLQGSASTKPFFYYVHTREPHLPYDPPKPFHPPGTPLQAFGQDEALSLIASTWQALCNHRPDNPTQQNLIKQAKRLYDGEIRSNDAAFGEFIQALKRAGHYDDTLIVLVSDHGEEFLDHHYLGHGNSLFQELLHVPLMIKFPHSEGAATRVVPCWQQIDIAPTILEYLGVQAPSTMVGHAFKPGAAPADGPPRPAFFTLKNGADGKLFGQASNWLIDMDGVRAGPWVYNRTWACHTLDRLEPEQLFDLRQDPTEQHNLAGKFPVRLARMRSLVLAQLRSSSTGRADQASAAQVNSDLRSLQYLR